MAARRGPDRLVRSMQRLPDEAFWDGASEKDTRFTLRQWITSAAASGHHSGGEIYAELLLLCIPPRELLYKLKIKPIFQLPNILLLLYWMTPSMVIESEGRVFRSGEANTLYVSIPSDVALDSAFPFEDGDSVAVRIEGDELRVISTEKEEQQPSL